MTGVEGGDLVPGMYLLIDNYDSFTYNLYQAFAQLGVKLLVRRNDEITISEIAELNPEKIIISPGPKTPDDAGISPGVIKQFAGKIPILGICLGHQCVATSFGGNIKQVEKIVHGKTSAIHHNGKGIFKGLSNPFMGARYHSLEVHDVPDCIEVTARTGDNVIMGLEHRDWPVTGLQFHPESFLTENGQKMIKNYLKM